MTQQKSNRGNPNFKKYAVFAIMFVAFAGCLWLIFAPSAEEQKTAAQGAGFNADIPDPRGAGIVSDKKTAYEEEQVRQRQEERLRTLQDYSYMLGEPENGDPEVYERQLRLAPVPPDYQEQLNQQRYGSSSGYASRRNNPIEASGSAYSDLTSTLGNFYEEPEKDAEKEALQAEIEELRNAAAAQDNRNSTYDDQVALLEKSFELAAKYMPDQSAAQAPVEGEAENRGRRVKVEAVTQVSRPVVSSLAQPMSDAEFVRQFSRERNFGFHTAGSTEQAADRNTIAAVVHGQQVLVDGQSVRLRTTVPMRAGRTMIPRNTVITGVGRIAGERLEITIASIEYGGTIIPVEMTAYDSDGQQGIYIPGSMEVEAVKEIAGNLGQGMGTTINLNQQSAGEQLLTDLGRGAIQGTSQYISKKAKQVKVTLKAGYGILLLPSENL